MADALQGKKVAILIAPQGTEQVEFTDPKKAVEDAGASVDVISDQTGEVRAVNNDLEPGDTFTVEKAFSEVSTDDAVVGMIIPPNAHDEFDKRVDGYTRVLIKPGMAA